jgi:hypothetical protein
MKAIDWFKDYLYINAMQFNQEMLMDLSCLCSRIALYHRQHHHHHHHGSLLHHDRYFPST